METRVSTKSGPQFFRMNDFLVGSQLNTFEKFKNTIEPPKISVKASTAMINHTKNEDVESSECVRL